MDRSSIPGSGSPSGGSLQTLSVSLCGEDMKKSRNSGNILDKSGFCAEFNGIFVAMYAGPMPEGLPYATVSTDDHLHMKVFPLPAGCKPQFAEVSVDVFN